MTFGLEGIKVIETATIAAAPMAGRLLADWGADVIHVENTVGGDRWRVFQSGQGGGTTGIPSSINYNWENYDRNKRSMTLDLSRETGLKILNKMLEKADVFLLNFRPREVEKFKLEYETLSQLNPRLIYASLTGYGKKGAERDLPAFQTTAYWCRSGNLHVLQEPGAYPFHTPAAVGDNIAALALAYGITTALYVREKTGVGQEVDVSLYGIGIFALCFDIAGALVTGRDRQPGALEDFPNAAATYYQTKDGKWLRLAVNQLDRDWSRFCQAIERKDLQQDPRFGSPEAILENRAALYHILKEVFLGKTLDEWKPPLNDAGLAWDPVQSLPEIVNDPQARANDFFVPYDHPTYGRIEVVKGPVKLSKTPETIRRPAPEYGQHTEEVLLEHGYMPKDIEQFRQQGIIL